MSLFFRAWMSASPIALRFTAHSPGCMPLLANVSNSINQRGLSGDSNKIINATHIPREGEELDEPDVLYRKLAITVKAHEPEVLNSYETFVREACGQLSIDLQCDTRHRPTFKRLSLNKSPFIYKKHQRQYEFRTYYKYMTVNRVTGCTADVLLEYIQRFLPEGVAMEVARHRLEALPDHIIPKASAET